MLLNRNINDMESIINQLSSRLKVNSNEPNKNVAAECIKNPALLEDIAAHLGHKDKKLAGDCAEVMTEVALANPGHVAKYSEQILPLLKHKETRVRWEAMHALALCATTRPDFIGTIIPDLREIINKDKSVIVRDYATDAVAGYASTSAEAAAAAFPFLKEVLDVWQDRHAGRVIEGLMNVYKLQPQLKSELQAIANIYKDSPRGVVKKAAARLEKLMK
jgi:hypothetical protein